MVAAGATAQVRLPAIPLPALPLQTLPQTLDQVQSQSLDRLSTLRHLEIGRLIRANPRIVDADPNGEPVVRSEILGLALTDAALVHARSLGFIVDREQTIGAMNFRVTVFRTPPGMSTKKALRTLREADPERKLRLQPHLQPRRRGRRRAIPSPWGIYRAYGSGCARSIPSAHWLARFGRRCDSPGVPRFADPCMGVRQSRGSRRSRDRRRVPDRRAQRGISRRAPGCRVVRGRCVLRPPHRRSGGHTGGRVWLDGAREGPGHQRQLGRSEERDAGEGDRPI